MKRAFAIRIRAKTRSALRYVERDAARAILHAAPQAKTSDVPKCPRMSHAFYVSRFRFTARHHPQASRSAAAQVARKAAAERPPRCRRARACPRSHRAAQAWAAVEPRVAPREASASRLAGNFTASCGPAGRGGTYPSAWNRICARPIVMTSPSTKGERSTRLAFTNVPFRLWRSITTQPSPSSAGSSRQWCRDRIESSIQRLQSKLRPSVTGLVSKGIRWRT